MTIRTNDDGLTIAQHRREGEIQSVGGAVDNTENRKAVVSVEVGSDQLDGSTGTHSLDPMRVAGIPEGSHLVSAQIHVEEAFTSGGAATVDLGLEKEDGVAIDADGIDAGLSLGSLSEGSLIDADGALVEGSALSYAGHVTVKVNTAALTGGKLRLVVQYR